MKFSPRLSSRKTSGVSSSTFDIQAEQDNISSVKDVNTHNKSSSSKRFPLKNLRRGKKDTTNSATEKPMSISVNGKPILEIHPTASVEDVKSFLDNVQTGIEAKTGAKEVADDDESLAESVECSLIDEEEAAEGKGVKQKKKSSKKLPSLRKLQSSAAKSMKSMKKVQKKSKAAPSEGADKKDTTTTDAKEEAAITNIGMVDSNAHKDVDVLENDDDDETESIEAVEQEGYVHIGFLSPMDDDATTLKDGKCNGYTPYHLQLMIDGVVVQTLAIHKQAMELLSSCITDAKQSKEKNDIVEEKKEENETDEIKEEEQQQAVDAKKEVTKEEQPDASEEEKGEEKEEQPAQQSSIHPTILDKLNDFIESAKKGFEEAMSPAAKEEVAPIEGEAQVLQEENEAAPQEDNRNDSEAEVDPALEDDKEDKSEEEEAGRDIDDHPLPEM